MSEVSCSKQLSQFYQQLEQALADADWDTLARLDSEVQGTVRCAEAEGITIDRQVVDKLKAFYPVMIKACKEERCRIEGQLKQLRTSKNPLQAYKSVAMTSIRSSG